MIPFRFIASGIFLFFMTVMLVVVYVAFTKKMTGVTGMDMSQIQELRKKSHG